MSNSFLSSFIAFVAIGILFLGACSSDDDVFVGTTFEEPEFRTFEWTPSTGTPQEQIDRFVAANSLDTTVTSSGLIYTIYDEGEPAKPTVDSSILVFYRGQLVDGRAFDGTTQNPTALNLSATIEGWKEGVPLIGRNGRILLIVRPELGYMQDGRPASGISGSTIMVFEIELVDFAG